MTDEMKNHHIILYKHSLLFYACNQVPLKLLLIVVQTCSWCLNSKAVRKKNHTLIFVFVSQKPCIFTDTVIKKKNSSSQQIIQPDHALLLFSIQSLFSLEAFFFFFIQFDLVQQRKRDV